MISDASAASCTRKSQSSPTVGCATQRCTELSPASCSAAACWAGLKPYLAHPPPRHRRSFADSSAHTVGRGPRGYTLLRDTWYTVGSLVPCSHACTPSAPDKAHPLCQYRHAASITHMSISTRHSSTAEPISTIKGLDLLRAFVLTIWLDGSIQQLLPVRHCVDPTITVLPVVDVVHHLLQFVKNQTAVLGAKVVPVGFGFLVLDRPAPIVADRLSLHRRTICSIHHIV